MDRVIHIEREELLRALELSAEDRLRQANAAFRLYHALHAPYANPRIVPGTRRGRIVLLDKEADRPS